jgi:hypothetical protein
MAQPDARAWNKAGAKLLDAQICASTFTLLRMQRQVQFERMLGKGREFHQLHVALHPGRT